LSEPAVSYAFEQLEASGPRAHDAPARLIAQATLEAERLRAEARTEGYADGNRIGREEGAGEVARLADALGEALHGIESLRGEVVEAIEHDALELGLQLAEKIVGGVLELRRELILDAVQGALGRVSERRRITVLVSPAELDLVKTVIGEKVRDSGVEVCEVRPDEAVAAGGAIVRTTEGEVDAGVETQLERAREVIEASLASERAA
jgi:flagellar assembly protein FliH